MNTGGTSSRYGSWTIRAQANGIKVKKQHSNEVDVGGIYKTQVYTQDGAYKHELYNNTRLWVLGSESEGFSS